MISTISWGSLAESDGGTVGVLRRAHRKTTTALILRIQTQPRYQIRMMSSSIAVAVTTVNQVIQNGENEYLECRM
jgi:hypothetical protein